MANFYTDNEDIKFHLGHPLMEKIVALKERNYTEAQQYDNAPRDFEDAFDNYDKVLEIVGEICGDVVAVNAESVDAEGPQVVDGHVKYAAGTQQNIDVINQAGLNGISLPRKYNGLNFPITPFIMAAEIVARADAGLQNIWGLQDCAETINEFASDEQKAKYLPRVCAGETCAMDLPAPDAGSDLQSVMLKATFDEENNCWRLNGVKRFITNGDADLHLVLARSEEGTRDGRGLSMFIYDKRDGGVDVRRIENKMGIHGSPTCELVYKNAKAELCGSRKLGLIKYVMALMNGARLGIAAQSVGLSQAAYNEALAYAKDREQIGKAIINFPAVYDMLDTKKANEEANYKAKPVRENIAFEDFQKLDIRVGTVLECTKVPKADKLLCFKIADGWENRTIVSGISKFYKPEELVGKQVCFIANLAPRKLKGIESQGMILSALNYDESLSVITVDREVKPGSEVC